MGKIREQMVTELDLRGMAAATKKAYLMCCRQFVAHFMRSPEQLGAAEAKEFIVHLIRARKATPSAVGVYVSAIRFLYRVVLRRPDVVEDLPRPRIPTKLPSVPNRDEIYELLRSVRSLKYRTILIVAYGAGLRISEACGLLVGDVDSNRMVIHVRYAKGAKDRLVPLSPTMLAALRAYWLESRPAGRFLFPGRGPGSPLTTDAVRKVVKLALAESGAKRRLTLHSLRHGFATHMLEDGEDVRVIQAVLGHSSIQTTAHYVRVTTERLRKVKSPIESLTRSRSATHT